MTSPGWTIETSRRRTTTRMQHPGRWPWPAPPIPSAPGCSGPFRPPRPRPSGAIWPVSGRSGSMMRKPPRPKSPSGCAASMTMADSPYPTPTVRRRSLSDLVEIDDLAFLDGRDLRAVFDQVSDTHMLEALIGITPASRKRFLSKLPSSSAARRQARLDAHGPVLLEAVQDAQRALVDALYRLSRGGQVAFDVPEDMVA